MSDGELRIGTRLDPGVPAYGDMREATEVAERLGYEAVWVRDHVSLADTTGQEECHEVWTVMTALAAQTERIKVGSLVLCTPFRNPALLAKMGATLDHLSGGRLILGVGSGWLEEEFDALGVDYPSRGAATDEALDTVVSLWTRRDEGRSARFEDIRFAPAPVQDPHPPILIGGNSRRAIRRAVELGQGWHPTTVLSEAELVALADHLQTSWEAAGRRGKPEIALGIPVFVTETPPDPEETWLGARMVAGSPEEVVAELRRLAAFVTHFVIHVVAHTQEELFAQLELIGREVLPSARLRS